MAVVEDGGAPTFSFVSIPPCVMLHFVHSRSCAL